MSGSGTSGSVGIPTGGLVAWYRTTVDLSGNGNDLAAAGNVTTTTDRFGNANAASLFSPGSSGDGATAISGSNPLLPVGTAPRTVSVWIQTSTDYGIRGNAGDFWNWGGCCASGSRFGELITQNGDTEYFVGQFADLNGTRLLNDGQWHNVIVTYDGASVAEYVDGMPDVNGSLALNTSGTTLVLGNAVPGHGAEPFAGALDDVLIYDRVLSPPEIFDVLNQDHGSCGSGLSACGGSCVDEQTDANNCGGCGRVCPTGVSGPAACVSGQCAPAQLASDSNNLGSFHSLAVDPIGANVYWASDGDTALHVYNLASAADTVLTGLGNVRPFHLAVDSTYVYVSDENSDVLEKVLIAAPYTVTTLSGGNGGEGEAIAADDNNLYWCSVPGGSGAPTVSQIPTSGNNTPVIDLFTGVPGSSFPRDLAIDSTTSASTVFWVDGTSNTVNAAPVGVANGNVVLVTGETDVTAIATDGSQIYWATSTPASGSNYSVTIKSAAIPAPLAAIPTGAITPLYTTSTATGPVVSLVVAGGLLSWSERSVSNSSVSSMLAIGGPVVVYGSGLGTVNNVALGTGPSFGALFWTEGVLSGSGDGLYEQVR
ncbi:MAG: hypothetical protein JST54_25335 [Deltaproteobacteria bacterium]|nr:hypothetical protein [Deltaproteobacteria bacterium]